MAGRLRRLIEGTRRYGVGHSAEVLRAAWRRRRWFAQDRRISLPDDLDDHAISRLFDRAARIITPWSIDPQERTTTIETIERLYGDQIRIDADRVVDGSITLLGLSTWSPPEERPHGGIESHRDYRTGRVHEPSIRSDRIDPLADDGNDIKYRWEIDRLHWIFPLGLAGLFDDNPIYVDDFRIRVDRWIDENRLNRGSAWTMPMEVGIRAHSLLVGAALFSDEERLDASFRRQYIELLYAHGQYLQQNLEYFPNLTNHYVANCLGLIVCGALFSGLDDRRMLDDGLRRMERQLHHQVCSDGLHYERSLPYHGLVLEMILLGSVIAERAGRSFGVATLAIVDRMIDATRGYLPTRGGSIPAFGDADDGRLLRLGWDEDLYDHRWLTEFRREDRPATNRPPLHRLLFVGAASIRGDEASSADPVHAGSRLYPEYGLAALRNDRATVWFDCGPIGLHGNNDTLSVAISDAKGGGWIVDPGTGCYTADPALRNRLRSSRAHNGPVVDNREVAEFAGLWRVREDRTAPEITEFTDGPGRSSVTARHFAWAEDPGVVVERSIVLEGPSIRIVDELTGTGSHTVAIVWAFAAGCRLEPLSDLRWRIIDESRNESLEFSSSHALIPSERIISPSYGIITPAMTLRHEAEHPLPLRIEYLCRFVSSRPG